MSNTTFIHYPHFSSWSMNNYEYLIHAGKMVHQCELETWSETHPIIPVVTLVLDRFTIYKNSCNRVDSSISKKQKDEDRDTPLLFLKQNIKLHCRNPKPEKQTMAERLMTAFKHVNYELDKLKYSEQSVEFAKLREIYTTQEMQDALTILGLIDHWKDACAAEDAFLAYEDSLSSQEKVEKRHTDQKRKELKEAMDYLTHFAEILTNVHKDAIAKHLMENFIIEMERCNTLLKTKETKKDNVQKDLDNSQ